ncbi:MAG TPA: OmpA family protein [Balneolaceae bacterium]|nr:OmpA family protein [Balneolaceae bacterium]
MNKLLLVVLLSTIMFASPVMSQDNEEPNRFSIGLLGGVTQGHMNIGTELDPTFGFNLRYAANPTVAVQANFMFGEMTTSDSDGFDDNGNYFERSFTNSYITSSFTSQLNLLRLLGSTSETVNLYASAGLGLIFNDVTTELGNKTPDNWTEFIGEDHSEPAFFGTFGTGLRFNLAKRVDLFAQYDFNISNSDLIDGHRTRPDLEIDKYRRTPDYWSSITAGLQIKFGSSDKDADWHTYQPYSDPSAIARLESQIAELDQRVRENTSRNDDQDDMIRALEDRMDEMNEKIDNLGVLIADMDRVDITVDSDILFAFDSSTIRETAKPTLAKVVRALANNPEKTLTVTGHTDSVGTEEYNQGLSERRAASVKRYLVQSGIDEDRITTYGRGETQPLVPNESPEARMMNRRVELVIE